MNIEIQENVPLAPLTTFRIGGSARYFTEIFCEEEFSEALGYAQENKLEVFVLGGGSNILVSDDGFKGLVIKLKAGNKKLEVAIRNSIIMVDCWAGDSLSGVVNFCKENSLTGLEWAVGIPGSIGGAIRGNAGAYGSEIKDSIISVKTLEIISQDTKNKTQKTNKIQNYKLQIPNKFEIKNDKIKNERPGFRIITNAECGFSYRNSIFKQNKNLIALSCELELQRGDKAEIEEKMKEIIRKRTEKIPKDSSPGSFFQNPTVSNQELIKKFEHDAGCECRGGKIPAAWLIEEAGLKGKKIGGAMVSEKHANFVVNTGEAKAQDVVMLASFIKMKIRNKFGIQLKEEIQFVGF